MAVLKGYLAKVYAINTSPSFSTVFTSEATTEDGTTQIYQIDATAKRLWDPNEPITLSAGTLDKTWMDGGIDWFTGRVKLNETGLTDLTVSGKYFATPIEIGDAYNWTIDTTADVVDISSFGNEWKTKTALQKNWTGSFEKFAIDDYWFDLAVLAKIFIVKFYTDSVEKKGYQGFALIPSLATATSVADVARETINLEGHWMLQSFDEV